MRVRGPVLFGLAVVTLCAAACGGPGADGVGSGGLLGSGGADGSGGSSSGGVPTGSGGTECVADPAERCSVPVRNCSASFCEDVCLDFFYCDEGAVYWSECSGTYLYDCPHGCEEEVFNGVPIYTLTESEVCNLAPGGTGGLGGGGAAGSNG